jgi:transposase InsO family protein
MVTTALKMALWRRDHGGRRVGDGLIHHSDAGSQYTSMAADGRRWMAAQMAADADGIKLTEILDTRTS